MSVPPQQTVSYKFGQHEGRGMTRHVLAVARSTAAASAQLLGARRRWRGGGGVRRSAPACAPALKQHPLLEPAAGRRAAASCGAARSRRPGRQPPATSCCRSVRHPPLTTPNSSACTVEHAHEGPHSTGPPGHAHDDQEGGPVHRKQRQVGGPGVRLVRVCGRAGGRGGRRVGRAAGEARAPAATRLYLRPGRVKHGAAHTRAAQSPVKDGAKAYRGRCG